jgi:hypothetical protein
LHREVAVGLIPINSGVSEDLVLDLDRSLEKLGGLLKLHLTNLPQLQDLSFLEKLSSLSELYLRNFPQLEDLEGSYSGTEVKELVPRIREAKG